MGLRLIAMLGLLLLAAGCRGDGDDTDAEGSAEGQRLSDSWYEVTVPETWEVVEEREDRVTATGEPATGNRPRQVVIEMNTGEPEDVRQLAHAMRSLDMTQLDDYEHSDWEPVEVAGADEALRDEASWTGQDRDGEAVPARGVSTYTLTGTTGVSMYVLAHEDDFDESWVEPIVQSLRVDP